MWRLHTHVVYDETSLIKPMFKLYSLEPACTKDMYFEQHTIHDKFASI